jgi:hypothetical protein
MKRFSAQQSLATCMFALSMSALTACASLQSISVTEVPQNRAKRVYAERDNLAFLGIHFSNDFADGLRQELYEQCPHGRVTGIFTKYEAYWYVLFQRRQVSATGYCVEEPSVGPAASAPAMGSVSSVSKAPGRVARARRP